MCIVVVLALVLLPLGGWIIGYANGGPTGGGVGVGIGLAATVLLVGVPTAIFFGIEKKKYDRENLDADT